MNKKLELVHRLIALTSSPNEGERTNAAVKACTLIREHRFIVTDPAASTSAADETKDEAEPVRSAPFHEVHYPFVDLAAAVAAVVIGAVQTAKKKKKPECVRGFDEWGSHGDAPSRGVHFGVFVLVDKKPELLDSYRRLAHADQDADHFATTEGIDHAVYRMDAHDYDARTLLRVFHRS